jgi:flagellar protein FlaG
MIIQNISSGQSALPSRFVNNDAPAVVADTPAPAISAPTDTSANVAIQPPSPQQLKAAVENVNKALQQSNLNLEFSVDPNTKTPVVKMMDSQSGKVIRQYPSEEVIAIAQSIDEYLSQHQLQSGMLLKQKA